MFDMLKARCTLELRYRVILRKLVVCWRGSNIVIVIIFTVSSIVKISWSFVFMRSTPFLILEDGG